MDNPTLRPVYQKRKDVDGKLVELRWEVWEPKGWRWSWHAKLEFHPQNDDDSFPYPWMEYTLEGGLAGNLGYTCSAFTRKRLEGKMKRAEWGALGFDRQAPSEVRGPIGGT